MNLLEGKIALVTGGTRGIGKAIVLKFAEEGADVAFTYMSNAKMAEDVVSEVEAMGRKALAICSDAKDFAAAQKVADEVIAAFGHIDVLVNNAGITRDALLIRMSEEQWDDVLTGNLKSAFNYCHAVTMHMLSRRKGSIVNVSSVVGIRGNVGQTNYSASKSGMVGLTCALSKEIGGRGVRVNAVAPGFIKSEMTEKLPEAIKQEWLHDIALKREGTPEEVANVALFLASDLSSYVTGETINVSGNIKG